MTIYRTRRGARNYGQAIGILQLDCSLPFIPGDVDNASTYDFPAPGQPGKVAAAREEPIVDAHVLSRDEAEILAKALDISRFGADPEDEVRRGDREVVRSLRADSGIVDLAADAGIVRA